MVEAKQPFVESNPRDQKKFAEQLSSILATFERAREWADLSNSLQRLKKTIDYYPNEPVPVKKELSKRLAQCLNPDLNVIHQQTIEVYQHIFNRETDLLTRANKAFEWGADLGLFYSGLFNFYQYAAFEVKRKFLDFVSENVLKFEKELIIGLPGFMLCMIPALEDQNQELLKRVERILVKTEEIVGTNKFFGEIWKTMLRTPRARLSAIKFLDRRIPKNAQSASTFAKNASTKESNKIIPSRYNLIIMKGQMVVEDSRALTNPPEWYTAEQELLQNLANDADPEAYCYFFYPKREQLCINALLSGLSTQETQYVNRATFDFLLSHLQVTDTLLSKEEKIRLMEGSVLTLKHKDFASHKKFFTWFQGHIEDDEQIASKEDPGIATVIVALKRIFMRFRNVKPTQRSGFVQDRNTDFELHHPLTFLLRLFDENMHICRPIVSEITVDLIRYIQHCYSMEEADDRSLSKLKQEVTNYFLQIKDELLTVWSALGDHLSFEDGHNVDNQAANLSAIDLIAFCLKDLRSNITQIDSPIAEPHILMKSKNLRLEEEKRQEDALNLQSMNLIPILSRLLPSIKKLSCHMEQFDHIQPALDLVTQVLDILSARKNESKPLESGDHLRFSIDEFSFFLMEALEHLMNTEDQGMLRQADFANFQRCCKILCDLQIYVDPSTLDSMPSWLQKVIDMSQTKSAKGQMKILLTNTSILLNILEREDPDQMPEAQFINYKKLQNLILSGNSNTSEPQSIRGTNYCMKIIQNLWDMLNLPGDHFGIVQLLKKFDLVLPSIFSDVVTLELNSEDGQVKLNAVEKFNVFWKLTAREYDTYKPFQPDHERQYSKKMLKSGLMDGIDRVEDDCYVSYDADDFDAASSAITDGKRPYVALHNMLLLLDDADPTLRLKCRSWLQDSKAGFMRILDPVIREFMDNAQMHRTFTGQLFYMENYDADIVIENFTKLRNIILTTQDQFSNYIVTTPCSNYIFEQFVEKDELVRSSTVQPMLSRHKYIHAIVNCTLSFIMGQAVQSLNDELYYSTQIVKASANEFMELILNSIKDLTELSREVKHLIVNPVITTLKNAIDNKNDAEQVHLLNLLRVILFEGEFYNKNRVTSRKDGETANSKAITTNAKNLFNKPLFLKCIVDGMMNEVAFVRYHYIQFAQKIIPFMKEVIASDKQVEHIKTLFMCFCTLLHCCDVSSFSVSSSDVARSKVATTSYDYQSSSAVAAKQSQKQLHITQENDIIQIIEGFKLILKDCLKIKDGATTDEEDIEQSLKELGKKEKEQTEGYGIFSFFTKHQEKQRDESETLTVKRALFDQIKDILLGCLNCWNDLNVFKVRNHFFTRLGIAPYHAMDDRKMETILRDYCNQNGYSALAEEEQKSEAMNKNKAAVSRQSQAKDSKSMMQKVKITPMEKKILTLRDYMEENFNPIQFSIISFFEQIVKTNPSQVVHGFLDVWKVASHFDSHGLNKNESCEKLIQMLLSMQIPPAQVLDAVNDWMHVQGYLTLKTQKEVVLDTEKKQAATIQSLICHFVYTYLAYCIHNNFQFMDQKQVEEDNMNVNTETKVDRKLKQLKELNEEGLKFLQNFFHTKSPVTVCWLLEILLLLSQKFTPAQIKLDKRHKAEFSQIMDRLLEKASEIMSDRFQIKYTGQYGIDKICYSPTVYEMVKRYEFIKQKKVLKYTEIGMANVIQPSTNVQNEHLLFSKRDLEAMDEIPLQKDSMFQTMDIVRNIKELDHSGDMTTFMAELNNFLHVGNHQRPNVDQQATIYKVFVIVTLRQILTKLTKNVHYGTDDNRYHSESIIVKPVLKVLTDFIDLDKNFNVFSIQVCSEFFADLLANLSEDDVFCKKYKVDINYLFQKENFFLMNERTLRKWQNIMKQFSLNNDDLVDELLLKFNQVGGLFTTKTRENKEKAGTFKRLAYIIYSADLNRFDEQLDNLLKKMTENFKNPSKDREMRMQLFLLSRIIMLRLTTDQLAEALKKLWPHLLAELVSVFDVMSSAQRDFSLTIEGIKIVELMSQLNIEDFQMNQWMFLHDGYGMEFRSLDQRMQAAGFSFNEDEGSSVFQPYIVKFMCSRSAFEDQKRTDKGVENQFVDYQDHLFQFYDNKRQALSDDISFTEPIPVETRAMASNLEPKEYEKSNQKPNSIDVQRLIEAEVFKYAFNLQVLLVESNTKACKIDRQGANAFIERDFLKKPRQM